MQDVCEADITVAWVTLSLANLKFNIIYLLGCFVNMDDEYILNCYIYLPMS